MEVSVVTAPPSLQDLTEAVASSWLVQWAGVVGHVAGRTALAKPHRPPRPTATRKVTQGIDSSLAWRISTENAVLGQRSTQEGRIATKSSCAHVRRTFGVKYESPSPPESCPQMKVRDGGGECYVSRPSPTSTDPLRGTTIRQPPPTTRYVPQTLDEDTVQRNAERCSQYFRSQLPPMLSEGIVEAAWSTVSELVTLGDDDAPVYRLQDWARRAPSLLTLATRLSNRKYTLDLSGLSPDVLQDVIHYVENHFPVQRLAKLVLSKRKFKWSQLIKISCARLKKVLEKASLVNVTMNLDVFDASILKVLSQLSLKELNVSGSVQCESHVLQGLGGLPYATAGEVIEAARTGAFWTYQQCPLRRSLRKLFVSLHNIPNTVYPVLLLVFSALQDYTHHGNAVHCIRQYARMTGDAHLPTTLGLTRVNLGRTTRQEVLEVARVCSALREVSLNVELNCEEVLDALRACEWLSDLKLSFYPPSVSSAPKLDGEVLLPILDYLRPQLQSLGLTGFILRESVMLELSHLPELRHLQLADCWLSHPKLLPKPAFPSLEALNLNFLPSLNLLRLLTASCSLQSLSFDFVASEGHGNALTDAHVQQFVTSGLVSSLHTFSASSPFLTLASLKALSSLPRLRSVARLSRWGLTEEELHCVGHSGPPHILCLH